MGTPPTLIWLICCLVLALGLVVLVLTMVARRVRAVRDKTAVPSWPDFVIVDCGDQIHFVPVDEAGTDGHVLGSGLCPCQARRTANRRRSGRRVVYVDHQSLDRQSAAQ